MCQIELQKNIVKVTSSYEAIHKQYEQWSKKEVSFFLKTCIVEAQKLVNKLDKSTILRTEKRLLFILYLSMFSLFKKLKTYCCLEYTHNPVYFEYEVVLEDIIYFLKV